MALFIIVCRITFVPDRLMNFLFPPILALASIRQLFFSIRESGKAMSTDSTLGWASLAIYLLALGFSFFGYTFVALLILIWWYFQLAVLLTILQAVLLTILLAVLLTVSLLIRHRFGLAAVRGRGLPHKGGIPQHAQGESRRCLNALRSPLLPAVPRADDGAT